MNPSDRVRIAHIIEAAREAIAFASGRTEADLFSDRMLTRSLERQIEIVGEAANKISTELQQDTPEILWADIVAMRNRLIHAYFDVNLSFVWSTVMEDLPLLIEALERVLARADRGGE